MFKILDVIKYEGNNDTFIWKHPSEDFNCFSQLIVHENQEAIYLRDHLMLEEANQTAILYAYQKEPLVPLLLKVRKQTPA